MSLSGTHYEKLAWHLAIAGSTLLTRGCCSNLDSSITGTEPFSATWYPVRQVSVMTLSVVLYLRVRELGL